MAEVRSHGDSGGPLRASLPVPPVLLTSGTTGTPKGAQRGRRVDPAAATGIIDRIPYRHDDVVAITSPLFHAWGLAQMLLAASLGATTALTTSFDAGGDARPDRTGTGDRARGRPGRSCSGCSPARRSTPPTCRRCASSHRAVPRSRSRWCSSGTIGSGRTCTTSTDRPRSARRRWRHRTTSPPRAGTRRPCACPVRSSRFSTTRAPSSGPVRSAGSSSATVHSSSSTRVAVARRWSTA